MALLLPPEQQELEFQTDDAAEFVDDTVLRVVGREARAPNSDEIVLREQNPRRINRTLENLARKSNAEYQDKALRFLYIAAGFLDWVDPARSEALSSPLILVPVELRRDSARDPYKLYFVDDEETVVNLDSDSSQRRAIEAARRGQSFVMHGPPGTGKSQTIANIIADAIGAGRRVLFVSEKAAALDVVHRRLKGKELDEFCLMLHGEHAVRREVVEALHRSLTSEIVPRLGMSSHELERLGDLREVLNNSAELVHLPMPVLADRSLRDVLGSLAELHAAPSIPKAPEPTAIEGDAVRIEFQQLSEIFERMAERWSVSPEHFVWRDYADDRFSSEQRDHGRSLDDVPGRERHAPDVIVSPRACTRYEMHGRDGVAGQCVLLNHSFGPSLAGDYRSPQDWRKCPGTSGRTRRIHPRHAWRGGAFVSLTVRVAARAVGYNPSNRTRLSVRLPPV